MTGFGFPIPRGLAAAAVILLFVSTLPAPASAYPGTVDDFEGDVVGTTVNISYPPRAGFAGVLAVPSNATVVGAQIGLTGSPRDLDVNFTHNATQGFPDGTFGNGTGIGPDGLAQRILSGAVEYQGILLNGGTFSGTAIANNTVVLTGSSGSYETPLFSGNNVSYGRFSASYTLPFGSSVSFSVLDSLGTVLQSGLKPGTLLAVDASSVASIRIHVDFTASPTGRSPVLSSVGAGYLLTTNLNAPDDAQGVLTTGVLKSSAGLELQESLYNWTESANNPFLAPAGGTWHAKGILTGSAVAVGDQVWVYVSGIDASNVYHIGRMVSSNGGQTWTVDAQPVLNATAATWDAGYVGIPTVVREDNGTFKMWYMGATTIDVFDIGVATSDDGITWTKYGSNPVVTQSSSGWDNYNVGWPVVVREGNAYTMFFAGRSSTDARKSIGYATSSDGFAWTKYGSNPVIRWGDTSAGAYDIVASDLVVAGGTYYLYWTCGSGSSAYDTCVSTSTNRNTWSHFSGNPVITHGDGTWDSVTAELATYFVDPVTGRSHMLFTGRPNSASYSNGRAEPKHESGGTAVRYFDLTGEVPRSFTSHGISASVPAGGSLQAAVAVGQTNASYGISEVVGNPDSSIATSPAQWLRYSLALSTSQPAVTPTVSSAVLRYDRYVDSGTYLSPQVQEPYPIRNATLTLNRTLPVGASLSLSVTNDGGATWFPAVSGVATQFPSLGFLFQYRLDFAGSSGLSAVVESVRGMLGVDSSPSDVVIEGPDGTAAGSWGGVLAGPQTIDLNASYFNERTAPYADDLPHFPVLFEVWLNSTTAGSLRVDFIHLDLEFPDELKVYFVPDTVGILVEVGESLHFRMIATTTPGVPITYNWTVDGVPLSLSADRLRFDATSGDVGNHTVRAVATNGQFTEEHTWDVRVVERPVLWVAKFYPGVDALEVPVTTEQFFYVAVANASGIQVDIEWRVDGQIAGNDAIFVYQAPGAPGGHKVEVSVSAAGLTDGWSWDVNVTAEPGTVLHVINATFAPEGPVELSLGQVQSFLGSLSAAPPEDVVWDWRVDGQAASSSAGSFDFASNAAGRFVVSVVIHNATALAAHSWTVTVLPPPLPDPPTVSISQPAEGAVVDTKTVRVDGTATPGTTVTVNGARVDLSPGGLFTTQVSLAPGTNTITVSARDSIGQAAMANVTVRYDEPPTGTDSPIEFVGGLPALALVLFLGAGAALFALLWYREYAKRRARDLLEAEPLRPPP